MLSLFLQKAIGGFFMNIGIFSDTFFPQLNGVATSIRTLATALEERGHNVYIFTPTDPRTNDADAEPNVFRLPSVPFVFVQNYRAAVLCPPSLRRKIDELQLDIIHTQTEFSMGMLGKLFSATRGIPMVQTYHTMYEDYVHYIGGGRIISQDMARDGSRIFCNAAMGVIAPTRKTEQLLTSYGVTKPISIIPTGINRHPMVSQSQSLSFPQASIPPISARSISTLRKFWGSVILWDWKQIPPLSSLWDASQKRRALMC